MIRLLFYSLIRFFIAALAIYFVLMLVRGIIRVWKSSLFSSSRSGQAEVPPKPKENYKDVQDAKFIEIPDKQKESSPDSNS